RGYARGDGKALIPSYTAFAVTELLETHFPHLVDSAFTSDLEDRLDMIAQGNFDPVKYLDDYYKGDKGLKSQVDLQEDKIDPQEAKVLKLPIEGLNGMHVHIG